MLIPCTITFRLKDTLLLWKTHGYQLHFNSNFHYYGPLAVLVTILCSRGRPHVKSCTSLHRSWSWKAAVDVNIFLRPHLRNWCWKPFSGMLLLSLLLSIMILIIGFTCPATIHFKFMTKCDDYNKVQQNMRDVVIWIHTIFHFLADFCLDVKAEGGNVWGPFIIPIMVGWVQPHPNGVMLNLSLYFKSFVRWETGRGEKLLFFIWTTNFSVFFFSVVVVVVF